MATLIDGKATANSIQNEIQVEVAEWTADGKPPPCLRVLLVGSNPASASYVRAKARAAEEVGIDSEIKRLSEDLSEAELLEHVRQLNEDPTVDGILVQLPLPSQIDEDKVLLAIDPSKDVDGFHPENAGRLVSGLPGFIPATPHGIMELLKRYEIETEGANAVVIGRSSIVGRPLANLLSGRQGNATVTLCHSRTRDLFAHTRQADIIVSAVGKPKLVTAEMVPEGATVIDVGINRVEDTSREKGYRLVGDVDFDPVSEKAGNITPVPGGVGPMTIAMMLKNTFKAARRRR